MLKIINNFHIKRTDDFLSIEYIINLTIPKKIENGIEALKRLSIEEDIEVTIDPKEKYGEFQLSKNSDIESLNILIRDTFYEGFSSGD